jgi:hypothetical protein
MALKLINGSPRYISASLWIDTIRVKLHPDHRGIRSVVGATLSGSRANESYDWSGTWPWRITGHESLSSDGLNRCDMATSG